MVGVKRHMLFLLTIEEYQKLADSQARIVDQLAMPGVEDIEFEQ